MKNNLSTKKYLLFALAMLIFIVIVISLYKQYRLNNIHSFEDCANAGYPIMLSYPGQCRTPDGRMFSEQLSEEEMKKLVPPEQ